MNQRAPTIQTSIPPSTGPQSSSQMTPNQSFRGPTAMQTASPTAAAPVPISAAAAQLPSPSTVTSPSQQQPNAAAYRPPQDNFTKASPTTVGRPQKGPNGVTLAANNPVFGMSLESLFQRDESAVPMVVHQCIQAVDLFGLDVEGIYRVSGNSTHISMLRALFDHGMSCPNRLLTHKLH